MNKPATISFNGTNLEIITRGLELDHVRSVVFERFIPIIENAIKSNKKSCIFCYVGEYSINIPEKGYVVVLDLLEEYYVAKEDWDKCIILRDLKIAINNE